MPPEPSPKNPPKRRPAAAPPTSRPRPPQPPARTAIVSAPISPSPGASADVGIAVAADAGAGGVVTARRAGGLRDMGLEVDPDVIGIKGALQHLAKAVNIAFQTDYGENYLEAV